MSADDHGIHELCFRDRNLYGATRQRDTCRDILFCLCEGCCNQICGNQFDFEDQR